MDECKVHFRDVCRGLTSRKPRLSVYSTVTGATETTFDSVYWWRNARQPVRFHQAVAAAASDGHNTFVEVSPSPTLIKTMRDMLDKENPERCVVSTVEPSDEVLSATTAMATLWARAGAVDLKRIAPDHALGRRQELPSFPWIPQRLWRETYENAFIRVQKRASRLLGHRLPGNRPVWLLTTDSKHFPMIGHHIFNGLPLFPASGFLEMMYVAARELSDGAPVALENVEIFAGLFLNSVDQRIQFRTEHSRSGNTIEVWSRLDGTSDSWTRHCLCTIAIPRNMLTESNWGMVQELMETEKQSYSGDLIYRVFAIGQFEYKQNLRMIQEFWRTRNEIVARIDAGHVDDMDNYWMHPSVLDACLHPLDLNRDVLFGIDSIHYTFVPVRIGRIEVPRRMAGDNFMVHVRKRSDSLRYSTADLTIYDDANRPIVQMDNVESLGVETPGDRSGVGFDRYSHTIDWITEANLDEVLSI